MTGLKASLQATTTATVTVKLQPHTRVMVQQRCEEHTELARQIKELKSRQERLRDEVDTLFLKEQQGQALLDGTIIDGFRVKMVCGVTRKLDTIALMKAHGLGKADLDACTELRNSTPYIKIMAPDDRDEEG